MQGAEKRDQNRHPGHTGARYESKAAGAQTHLYGRFRGTVLKRSNLAHGALIYFLK